jgi:Putative prokaryotic signal transducing protein
VDVPDEAGEDGRMQLVRVYETIDPIRGLLLRALLESDGIEVLAKGEGSGPYRLGPVILFVPDHEETRARELIAASEDGSLALDPDEEPVVEELTD